MTRVYKVQPQIKHYDWGKYQSESLVYTLYKFGNESAKTAHKMEKDTPYAELWLGTHKSGPCNAIPIDGFPRNQYGTQKYNSQVQNIHPPQFSGACMQLSSVIEKLNVSNGYSNDLPWPILFKVLSIGKPLSIQIHPDEETSSRLLKRGHATIVDDNAKAEMCVAICNFRAMAGFRSLFEVIAFAERYPKFGELITASGTNINSLDMPTIFSHLVRNVEHAKRAELVKEIIAQENKTIHAQFLQEIIRHFDTSDPCTLLPLVLQCHELQPGEALYIAPNTIHAYIGGECVEVMNNSDNVIRCGLSSKACDVETCIDIVSNLFLMGQHLRSIYLNVTLQDKIALYVPDDEGANFQLASIELQSNQTVEFNTFNTVPVLLLVLKCDGDCTLQVLCKNDQADASVYNTFSLEFGTSLFVPQHANLKVTSGQDSNLSLYIAAPKFYCN